MRVVECRACSGEIFFAVSRNGKKMPMDADPLADGEFALFDPDVDVPEAEYLKPGMARYGEDRYRCHFSTCPEGNLFRKG